MRLPSLSISIACYNDEAVIATLIEQSAVAAANVADRVRVFVVDDGSADGSRDILRKLAGVHSWLETRFHPRNLGFGATFGELYSYRECDFNAILPGDGQIAPDQVTRMAEAIGDADVVLGVRATRMDSLHRKMNSGLYNCAVSIAAGRRVRDVNSVSLARTALVSKFHFTSRSAFIHAEFLLECYRAGAVVQQVEIEHRPRGHGAGAGARMTVIAPTVLELGKYALLRGPTWCSRKAVPSRQGVSQ